MSQVVELIHSTLQKYRIWCFLKPIYANENRFGGSIENDDLILESVKIVFY